MYFGEEGYLFEYERRRKLEIEYNSKDSAELLIHFKNSHGVYDFIYTYEESKYKADYSNRSNWLNVKSKILEKNIYPNILEDFNLDIEDDIYSFSFDPH